MEPSADPSSQPSSQPSQQPSGQPSSAPSSLPSMVTYGDFCPCNHSYVDSSVLLVDGLLVSSDVSFFDLFIYGNTSLSGSSFFLRKGSFEIILNCVFDSLISSESNSGCSSSKWHFISSLRSDVVTFDDKYSLLKCSVATGAGDRYSVIIRDEHGVESSQRCDQNVHICVNFPTPKLLSVEPKSGPTYGGFNVSLSGEYLGWSNFPYFTVVEVYLNDLSLHIVESSLNTLVVHIPPGEGRSLTIRAVISGFPTNLSHIELEPVLFSYNEPVLYSASVGFSGTAQTDLFEGCSLHVNGLNFGSNPTFIMNGIKLELQWHNHTSAILQGIPPGQGPNNCLSVIVAQQRSSNQVCLSYEPPYIVSISRRESSIFGDIDVITLAGANFGVANRQSEVVIFVGPFAVKENIELLNSSVVTFKPPRGFGYGWNLSISVSGLLSPPFDANFSFTEPVVNDAQTYMDPVTGRGVVNMSGVGLGTKLTVPVSIYLKSGEHSCWNASALFVGDDGSSNGKYDHDECIQRCWTLDHSDSHVSCAYYPQLSNGTTILLTFGTPYQRILHFPLTFRTPILVSLNLERQGDASGNELIDFRGSYFGSLPPQSVQLFAFNNFSHHTLCAHGNSWTWGSNRRNEGPVIQCVTNPLPVGLYNVTAVIGGVRSNDFGGIEFICRRGSYGSVGQYCSTCDTSVSGWACDDDNMTQPISKRGWYLFEGTCRKELLRASTCPLVYPCVPKDSCLGNNTCAFPYTGVGCLHCDLGYFRINSQCKGCAASYVAMIVLFVSVIALLSSYTFGNTAGNEFLSRAYLFIDFLQTLALASNVNNMLDTQYSLLSSALNILTVFYGNWELWNVNCWNLFKPLPYAQLYLLVCLLWVIGLTICGLGYISSKVYDTMFGPSLLHDSKSQFLHATDLGFSRRSRLARSLYNSLHLSSPILRFYGLVTFVTIVVLFLSPFNCVSSDPRDGNLYLSYLGMSKEAMCYDSSSSNVQYRLMLYSSVFLTLACVGLTRAFVRGSRSTSPKPVSIRLPFSSVFSSQKVMPTTQTSDSILSDTLTLSLHSSAETNYVCSSFPFTYHVVSLSTRSFYEGFSLTKKFAMAVVLVVCADQPPLVTLLLLIFLICVDRHVLCTYKPLKGISLQPAPKSIDIWVSTYNANDCFVWLSVVQIFCILRKLYMYILYISIILLSTYNSLCVYIVLMLASSGFFPHQFARQFISICFISAVIIGTVMAFSLLVGWPCLKDSVVAAGYRKRTIYSEMEAAEVSGSNRLPVSPLILASGEGDLILSVATAIDNDISDEEPRLLKPTMNNCLVHLQNPIVPFSRNRFEAHGGIVLTGERKTEDSTEIPAPWEKRWKRNGKFKRYSRKVSVQRLDMSRKISRVGACEQQRSSLFFSSANEDDVEEVTNASLNSSSFKASARLQCVNSNVRSPPTIEFSTSKLPDLVNVEPTVDNQLEAVKVQVPKRYAISQAQNEDVVRSVPPRQPRAFISLLDDARIVRKLEKEESQDGESPVVVSAPAESPQDHADGIKYSQNLTLLELKSHVDHKINFQAGRYKSKVKHLRRPGNAPLHHPPPLPHPGMVPGPPFPDSTGQVHGFSEPSDCAGSGKLQSSTPLERKVLRRVERKSLINRPPVVFDPQLSPISATLLLPKPPGDLSSSQVDIADT
ncbi:hypothetical protein EON63_01865 [archaeon]|nr:MAG: hypothetical protein EON63_01865 [archaeon]